MASAARRDRFDPYRNMNSVYDGSAVRVLEQPGDPRVRPQVTPRRQTVARPKVEPRQAGAVSLFAVCGFAAVAVLAALIIMSYVQLAHISGDVVALNNQMEELRSEEATLRTRYELAYDLGVIEDSVTSNGSMSRPRSGQMVYVDLTEPDSVVVYDRGEELNGGFLSGVGEIWSNIVAYF